MPNLIDIIEQEANTNIEDIKDVPPIPVGSYLVQIVGHYEMVKSTQKQTDGLQFTLRFLQARDDVDRDSLSAYLDAAGSRLSDVTMKHTIYDSPYAKQSIRDVLLAAGCEGPLKQALADVPGKQMIVNVTHRPFERDGQMRLQAQIGSFARAL